jgi:cytochrome oxidase assembly protein ShyY1
MKDNNKLQVEGHSELYKDPHTGVIVNRGCSDRQRYRIAKQQARKSLESEVEIDCLRDEVEKLSHLSEEIEEIKSLLKELLGKNVS